MVGLTHGTDLAVVLVTLQKGWALINPSDCLACDMLTTFQKIQQPGTQRWEFKQLKNAGESERFERTNLRGSLSQSKSGNRRPYP